MEYDRTTIHDAIYDAFGLTPEERDAADQLADARAEAAADRARFVAALGVELEKRAAEIESALRGRGSDGDGPV